MDALEACLKDLVIFKNDNNKKAMYYKSVESILQIVAVLERFYMYNLEPNKIVLTEDDIEELIVLSVELIQKAEFFLPEVCELTKESAQNYAAAHPSSFGAAAGNKVSVPLSAPYTAVSIDEKESPVLHVMEEPVPIKVPEEEYPTMPMSLLDVERYSLVMQFQLIIQKLGKYIEASPKARSNASYVSGLRALLEEIWMLLRRKIIIEREWNQCLKSICFTDIHPKAIAEQLTLLDARIFKSLDIEWLYNDEPGREYGKASRNLYTFIASVVQFEILAPKEPFDRIKALNNWVLVCLELTGEKLYSFNVLKAIVDAITSANVQRAKGLREGLATSREYEVKKLRDRMSPKNNYKSLRAEMEGVNLGAYGCLPYLDVYLKDLDMLHSSRAVDVKTQRKDRMEAIREIVQRLIDFQIRAQDFIEKIEPNPQVQHWLLTRPFKNSQELDNLAVSRSESGGKFSPTIKSDSPSSPPNIIDMGDEGTILMKTINEKIIGQIKSSSRAP